MKNQHSLFPGTLLAIGINGFGISGCGSDDPDSVRLASAGGAAGVSVVAGRGGGSGGAAASGGSVSTAGATAGGGTSGTSGSAGAGSPGIGGGGAGGLSAGGLDGGGAGGAENGGSVGRPAGLPPVDSGVVPIGTPTTGVPIDVTRLIGDPGVALDDWAGRTLEIQFWQGTGFFKAPMTLTVGPFPKRQSVTGLFYYDKVPVSRGGASGVAYVSWFPEGVAMSLANVAGAADFFSERIDLYLSFKASAGVAFARSPTQSGSSGIVMDSTYVVFMIQ